MQANLQKNTRKVLTFSFVIQNKFFQSINHFKTLNFPQGCNIIFVPRELTVQLDKQAIQIKSFNVRGKRYWKGQGFQIHLHMYEFQCLLAKFWTRYLNFLFCKVMIKIYYLAGLLESLNETTDENRGLIFVQSFPYEMV